MLTPENYQLAWLIYTAASLGAVLYLRTWWRRRAGPGLSLFLFLGACALLLTPAHPDPDTPSYAPALVVAGFDLLTHGPEAAIRPLRPIGFTLIVALGLAVLVALVSRLRHRSAPAAPSES